MLADRLVAHRGFQKHYPENTLLAHRKAIEAGAHNVETDIHFTADGEPVLFHDLSMKRLTGQEGLITGCRLDELSTYSAFEPSRLGSHHEGEPIAHLDELVKLIGDNPQVTAFIEVKETAIIAAGQEPALKRLRRALDPIEDQAVLISFDHGFIHYAALNGYPRLGAVIHDWRALRNPAVIAADPDYIFCDQQIVPEQSAELDNLPFNLVVYEVGDAQTARHLFDLGVDMVETFDIGGLLHDLNREAL